MQVVGTYISMQAVCAQYCESSMYGVLQVVRTLIYVGNVYDIMPIICVAFCSMRQLVCKSSIHMVRK